MNAYINGREYSFNRGETVLNLARRNGIHIPHLCFFAPLGHMPGVCRVCLVEVEDDAGFRVAPACETPVSEGMRIGTASPRLRAMRRAQVELLLADHDQDCSGCARHGDCELQDLGEAVGLGRNRFAPSLRDRAALRPLDESAAGMTRDMGKCVRCLRCVQICRQVQGVAALSLDGKGQDAHIGVGDSPDQAGSACVQCGQCIQVCPTGALAERDENERVLDMLADPGLSTVFSFAPSVRVLLAEEAGSEAGANVEGRIVAALRALGADVVLDTNFGADVVIMEEGSELLDRLKAGGTMPMFTSCCPGWVNFAEKHMPAILPHVSSTRSPQGVLGALSKSYLARSMNLDPARIRTISIMPCIAKKDEAARPQLGRDGRPDVDVVITVREFSRLLRRMGLRLDQFEPQAFDNPFMSDSSGAAAIFGSSGGVMEAAVRTVYALLNGHELEALELSPLRGMQGVREAEIDLGPGHGQIRVAVCHGLRNARKLAEQALAGQSPYSFVEVMACPGGCIAGGGTPRAKGALHPKAKTLQQGLYRIDRELPRRQSHRNPQLQKLYADYLERPNSHLAHELLHTSYADRSSRPGQTLTQARQRLTLVDE